MGKNTLLKSSILLAFSSFGGIHLANADVGSDTENDDHLVIVGTRSQQDIYATPADITLISSDQLQQTGAITLGDALRGLIGVQVSDNGSNLVFSMRGFSSEQAANNTLILMDGRRLNHSDIAAPDLNAIPLNRIDHIEVLNGSAGVLYGDQAVGGVINIITKQASGDTGHISLGQGSYNKNQLSVDLTHGFDEHWNLLISGHYLKTNNYRQHNDDHQGNLLSRVNYRDDGKSFFFEATLGQDDIETPGALLIDDLAISRRQSRDEFSHDFVNTQNRVFRTGGTLDVSDHWQFQAELLKSKDDIKSLSSFVGFSSTFEASTRRKLLSFTPRMVGTFATSKGNIILTAGVDVDESDYSFDLLGRDNHQKVISAYFQSSIPLTTQLTLTGGARHSKAKDKLVDPLLYAEGVSLNNSANAFTLGLAYQIQPNWRIFSRLDKNFRFAKVDEQAFTSPGVLGLDPQTGMSLELGTQFNSENGSYKISLFQLKLKDEIIFDPFATPPEGSFFFGANVNGDKSRRLGLLVQGNYQLNPWLNLDANYTYIDAETTSGLNDGNKLPAVAKNVARLALNIAINADQNLYIESQYNGKRFQDGDAGNFGAQLKSYSLLNLGYNRQWTPTLGLHLRINNLLNKEYPGFAQFDGFFPAAKINGNLSIDYNF